MVAVHLSKFCPCGEAMISSPGSFWILLRSLINLRCAEVDIIIIIKAKRWSIYRLAFANHFIKYPLTYVELHIIYFIRWRQPNHWSFILKVMRVVRICWSSCKGGLTIIRFGNLWSGSRPSVRIDFSSSTFPIPPIRRNRSSGVRISRLLLIESRPLLMLSRLISLRREWSWLMIGDASTLTNSIRYHLIYSEISRLCEWDHRPRCTCIRPADTTQTDHLRVSLSDPAHLRFLVRWLSRQIDHSRHVQDHEVPA